MQTFRAIILALGGLMMISSSQGSALTCPDCSPDGPRPGPTPGKSCLAPGTLISMVKGGGLQVTIEQLQVGQSVISLEKLGTVSNPPTFGSAQINRVYRAVNGHPMYRLTDTLGHTLTATGHHPIFTVNRGMVQLAKLRPSDLLLTTQGRAQLSKLELVHHTGEVFNLVVEPQASGKSLPPTPIPSSPTTSWWATCGHRKSCKPSRELSLAAHQPEQGAEYVV